MRNTISNESGRSMIEMLGVLAIIGVLSVGGIAGYSMAMSKFKTTKTIDQIQQITTNMRSILEGQRRWPEITAGSVFYSLGVLTEETWDGTNGQNPFGGHIALNTGLATSRTFTITYDGLPKDVCIKLATTDWGGDAGSGLYSIQLNGNSNLFKWGDATHPLPVGLSDAITMCTAGSANTIIWSYK